LFLQFAGQWHNVAYNERANFPEDKRCQKVNVVSAEVDGGVGLTYNYDYIENGKPTKAQIVSNTYKTGFPGLFYGVYKREDITKWSSKSKNQSINCVLHTTHMKLNSL